MKEFLSKYRIEVLIIIAIITVMFVPYFILSSGQITDTEKLQQFENITREFTPLIIGVLCILIVYRAIKRNREDR